MSKDIQVIRHGSRWEEVSLKLDAGFKVGLGLVAAAVQQEVVKNISSQNIVDTGSYMNSWGIETRADQMEHSVQSPHPSKPNNPRTGTPVNYGVYIEYGYTQAAGNRFPIYDGNSLVGFRRTTGKVIPARPHVKPAAETVADRAPTFFKGML